MSRIGKQPIELPEKVKVTVSGEMVTVQGPKGNLEVKIPPRVTIKVEGSELNVVRPNDDRQTRAFQGLARSLLANAVTGVSEGFRRELDINGVGYRAEAKGKEVHLQLGYSHPVVYDLPEAVTAQTPTPTKIILESANKQIIGEVAAQIRALRPPEPYKGKGIKYAEEHIRRKVGKTAA